MQLSRYALHFEGSAKDTSTGIMTTGVDMPAGKQNVLGSLSIKVLFHIVHCCCIDTIGSLFMPRQDLLVHLLKHLLGVLLGLVGGAGVVQVGLVAANNLKRKLAVRHSTATHRTQEKKLTLPEFLSSSVFLWPVRSLFSRTSLECCFASSEVLAVDASLQMRNDFDGT